MSRTRTFPGAFHSPTTPTSATSSIFTDPNDHTPFADPTTNDDPIARDLAVLDQLHRNVQTNLKLRPISPNNLSAQSSAVNSNHHTHQLPTDHPPEPPYSAVSNVSSNHPFYTPIDNWNDPRFHSRTDSHDSRGLSASSFSSYYFYDDSDDEDDLEDEDAEKPDQPVLYDPSKPRPFEPNTLLRALLRPSSDSPRSLLIDTRPAGSYLASRLPFSLNIAIPSLILKRCLKPGGGFSALSSVRPFISTERGKVTWDSLLNTPGAWDGTAIIYDEDMDENDPLAPIPPPSASGSSSMAWTLLSVLKPLIPGTVYFLRGGISAIRRLPRGDDLIVSGEREIEVEGAPLESPADLEHHVHLRDSIQILPDANGGLTLAPTPTKRSGSQKGLFQLRTDIAARHKPMPELEPPTTSPGPLLSPRRSATIDTQHHHHTSLTPGTGTSTSSTDSSETPSPPRSAIPPSTSNRPTLTRLDISKGPVNERLKAPAPPKLQLQLKTTPPVRSTTLPTPAAGKGPKLKLRLDTPALHPNPVAASVTIVNIPSSPEDNNAMSPPPSSPRSFVTAPRSPGTPLLLSPMTARPVDEDTSPAQEFVISTILPGFLFLGPEIVLPEQAQQLEERGVKRILNIAIECDDDQGLNLRQRFERYIRIPMRDTVEEANVARRMREVCDFLGANLYIYVCVCVCTDAFGCADDARLHSSPTYVHCKAGKSRSVTAIMAYLIHANHWTLSRAYAFVLDRRKGISPNIGFVSELMSFEEEELGGKSIGVVGNGAVGGGGGGGGGNSNYGQRRGGHLRESMPPAVLQHDPLARGLASAGPLGINDLMMLRDVGEEMEIRDANGRYRHARRAPVDEYTLQPTRRVSKAGLESAWGEQGE